MKIGSQEIDGNLSIYWDTRVNRKNSGCTHSFKQQIRSTYINVNRSYTYIWGELAE